MNWIARQIGWGDPQRLRDFGFATLIVILTAWVGATIDTTYPVVFLAIAVIGLLLYMVENQEKTLYLLLWFSTVYLTLKATVFGWSEWSILLKDGAVLLLFAFWFFTFLIKNEKIRLTPLSTPLLVLCAWLVAQCFNPNTYGAMSILQDLRFWLIPLGIFQLTVQLVDTRTKIERALKVVFIYALIETVYGLSQQLMPGDLLVKLGANPDSYFYFSYGTVRSFSTMGTVGFALFASMFPTISFFYMSQQRNPLYRALFFWLAFVFSLGVLFTLVRTGWFAVAGTITAYAFATRRWKILVAILVVLLLLFTLAQGWMAQKLYGIFNPGEDVSVRTRLQIFNLVTEAIVFRAFGYGLGTFAHNRFGEDAIDRTGYGTATENWYLMASLELGWVGILMLVWIWYKTYRFAWRNYRTLKTDRYREMSIGLAGSLFAIEIARMGGPSGYYPPDSWHYWFFAGLLMNVPIADDELAAEQAGTDEAAAEPANVELRTAPGGPVHAF